MHISLVHCEMKHRIQRSLTLCMDGVAIKLETYCWHEENAEDSVVYGLVYLLYIHQEEGTGLRGSFLYALFNGPFI